MGADGVMDEKTILKEVREYVVENFLLGEDEEELSNSDSFLESGLIDSTGILEVIAFLEETYDVEIEDEEMIPENLDSVERVARFIASKKGS
jgi:acyl carrier protein